MNNQNLPEQVTTLYQELETILPKFPELQAKCPQNSESFRQHYIETIDTSRLLRLAVIGQVNSGKSSFLNTLLFNGEEILPKASTPKTANLTIIRYSEDCYLEVEFYSQNDWNGIKSASKKYQDKLAEYNDWMAGNKTRDTPRPENPDLRSDLEAAYWIVENCKNYELDVSELIARERERIDFVDYCDMESALNEYVGDNGKYTPITKALYFNINDPRLKNLEIVDTPGLNDPVSARTQKTRESLGTIDVAFFISDTSSSFFDAEDMNLLVSQLPEHGINYFVLIGTKYDSALLGEYKTESLAAAELNIKTRYNRHLETNLNHSIMSNNLIHKSAKEKLQNSLPALYVSAFTHNFVNKDKDSWSSHEAHVYDRLKKLSGKWEDFDFSNETFLRLANFDPVNRKYEQVKQEKQSILEQKIKGLAPTAALQLLGLIESAENKSETFIRKLESEEVADLEEQEKYLNQKVSSVKLGVMDVFGSIMERCDSKMLEMRRVLRKEISEQSKMPERTGTRKETQTKGGYKTKYFLFIFPYKSYYTYDVEVNVSYRYATVNNAIDNLRKAADFAANSIEAMFDDLINRKEIRNQLLNVIHENLELDGDSFDPNFIKLIIQEAIEKIDFPSIKIDASNYMEELVGKFPNPKQQDEGVDKLKLALASSIKALGMHIIEILEKESKSFKKKINDIRQKLGDTLIEDSLTEIAKLKKAMQNKEQEIEEYTACIDACRVLSVKVENELY